MESTHDISKIRREIRRSLVINAAAPFGVYQLAVHDLHVTPLTALLLAASVPAVAAMVRAAGGKRIDLVGAVSLAALAVSAVGAALGGGTTVVLLRDSFVTAGLAVASFVSLATSRPLMFHIVKRLRTGDDADARAAFDQVWDDPAARHRFRLTTAVWGFVYGFEVVMKVAMIAALPAATVLALSPVVVGGLTLATVAWTIRYFQSHAPAPATLVA